MMNTIQADAAAEWRFTAVHEAAMLSRCCLQGGTLANVLLVGVPLSAEIVRMSKRPPSRRAAKAALAQLIAAGYLDDEGRPTPEGLFLFRRVPARIVDFQPPPGTPTRGATVAATAMRFLVEDDDGVRVSVRADNFVRHFGDSMREVG